MSIAISTWPITRTAARRGAAPVISSIRRTTETLPAPSGFGRVAAIARFVQTRKRKLGVATSSFRCRARRATDLAADRTRGHALRRQQDNPRPLPQSMLVDRL